MMTMSEKESRIEAFHRAAKSIVELFEAGELLTGQQENTLIDTIHDLQMGYTKWLTRQPLKEQSFPPDGQT
jgi:hypothetical protein